MSFVLGDRAVQTSTTTGTGTFNLDAPATGLRSFVTEVGSGNTTAFLIVDALGNWEINTGTVTSGSPDTITRTNPPIKSSNANALVNFPAGSKTVACVPVASLFPYFAAVPSYADNQVMQRVSGAWAVRTPQQLLYTLGINFTFKDIAVGATVNLASSDDIGVNITGAGPVTITSFGTQAKALRFVRFNATGNTVQNNANIILRPGANRTPSAGDIMLLFSDGSGIWNEMDFWPADPEDGNFHIVSHSFHYPGLVESISGTANKMLRHYVNIPTGYQARLVGCRYSIEDGTSVAFEVRRNGAGATGFTGLSATTTPQSTTPAQIVLSDNDYLEVVHSSPSGNPHNFVCTIFVKYGRTV